MIKVLQYSENGSRVTPFFVIRNEVTIRMMQYSSISITTEENVTNVSELNEIREKYQRNHSMNGLDFHCIFYISSFVS